MYMKLFLLLALLLTGCAGPSHGSSALPRLHYHDGEFYDHRPGYHAPYKPYIRGSSYRSYYYGRCR